MLDTSVIWRRQSKSTVKNFYDYFRSDDLGRIQNIFDPAKKTADTSGVLLTSVHDTGCPKKIYTDIQ